MRHAILCALVVFAVCCAGCLDGYYWQGVFPRPYQRTRPPAPAVQAQAPDDAPAGEAAAPGPDDSAAEAGPTGETVERTRRLIPVEPVPKPAAIHPQRIAVGLSIGNVYGTHGEAVEELRDSEFENGMLVGANIAYIPEIKETRWSNYFITRYGIELRVEEHHMMLSDRGLNLGELHTNSAVIAFRLYQEPKEGNVFGFHLDLGLGWGSTYFLKDDMLKQDDIDNSRYTQINPGAAQILAFGGGLDLYIAPDTCISLDLRYEDVYVPLKWKENSTYITQRDRLNAGSDRLVITLRKFF